MATTSYATGANETVKLWAKKLLQEALSQTYASRFMGSGSDSMIQIQEDTQKGPGDRIRTTLRMLLSGDGIGGDGTLEGNEEALTTHTDDILIDQLRHAVRSGGKMLNLLLPCTIFSCAVIKYMQSRLASELNLFRKHKKQRWRDCRAPVSLHTH